MIKMRTDSNDNAIQEQNRALGDLHQLHVDDIGAVGEEISRVEFKHDGLSVSKNFIFFIFSLWSNESLISALCEHNDAFASFMSRISRQRSSAKWNF